MYCSFYSTSTGGINKIPGDDNGYSLGRGGSLKLMHIGMGEDDTPSQNTGDASANTTDNHFSIEVPGICLSVIDDQPREVLLLSFIDTCVLMRSIHLPSGSASQLSVTVGSMQIDDQLPGSRFPVVVSPLNKSQDSNGLVRFDITILMPSSSSRVIYPFVGLRTTQELQLALHEALLWRMLSLYDSIIKMRDDINTLDHDTSTIDPAVRLRLLSVGSTKLSVSFCNESLSRPPSVSEGMIGMVMDLANFQEVKMTLKGFEIEGISANQSTLTERITQVSVTFLPSQPHHH